MKDGVDEAVEGGCCAKQGRSVEERIRRRCLKRMETP
jgi:hypothetical protein